MMENKWKLATITLAVIILAGVVYGLAEEYKQEIQEINQTAYELGFNAGVQIGQLSIFDGAYNGGAITFSNEAGNVTVFSPNGCVSYCNALIQDGRG